MALMAPQSAEELIDLFARIGDSPRERQDALRVLSTVKPEHFEQRVKKGFTAPYYALKYVPNDLIVQVLETMDRKINLRDISWGDDKLTPLMVAGRELKKAAVDWLVSNKRADPEERRRFIVTYCGRREEGRVQHIIERLGQMAGATVQEEDLRTVLSAVRKGSSALPVGPVGRLFSSNGIQLSTEALELVFGPGTRLVEEAALEYVRRTMGHRDEAGGIINELEAHRQACKKKVAALFEEIKRPSPLEISYEQLESIMEEVRRIRTLELLRQRKVGEHALRVITELPCSLTYASVAKALKSSPSSSTTAPLSPEEWTEHMSKACEERLIQLLRERGVVEGLSGLPRIVDASASGAIKLLAMLRRCVLRGSLKKHLGEDTALLVNFRDWTQGDLSPLMLAARVGNVEAMQELLSFGANCNVRDEKGRTALFYAIDGAREFSHYERRLLAVLDALAFSYRPGVDPLVDLDAQDYKGMTPLMHVAAVGSVEAVKWLLQPRSPQDRRTARVDAIDHRGWTAAFYATLCKDEGRMRLVLRELVNAQHGGCDINIKARDSCTVIRSRLPGLANSHEQIERDTDETAAPRQSGLTALMLAAYSGRFDCVSELLALGADVYVTDDEDWTALHHALKRCPTATVCRRIVALLREYDGRDNGGRAQQSRALLALPSKQGATPLMMAVQRGSIDLLSDLLSPQPGNPRSLPADPNAEDMRGETALCHCLRTEQLKTDQAVPVLQLLHRQGAAVNAVLGCGLSPLMLAAQLGKLELLLALLQLQELTALEGGGTRRQRMKPAVDPDVEQDAGGFTAMFFAVGCPDQDKSRVAIMMLRHHGANLDHRSNQTGCTPLMLAAELGNAVAALTLLELGAQPDLKDATSGATAIMYGIHHHRGPSCSASSPHQALNEYQNFAQRQLLMTQVLVEKGKASVYERDHAGNTALMRAVSTGIPELVDYLLAQRPLQQRRAKYERSELTPDHTTSSAPGSLRVIDFALASWDRSEDPVPDDRACAVLSLLASYGASLDVLFFPGSTTLLMKAASRHYVACTTLIAETSAATLRRTDDRGWTALHHVLAPSGGAGPRDLEAARLIDILASRGANLRAAVPSLGLTPLMMAAGMALPSTVALILERCPAAVMDVDLEGRSALHYAICSGDGDSVGGGGMSVQENPLIARTVEELMGGIQQAQCFSMVSRADKKERATPLMLAASRSQRLVMQKLLSLAVYRNKEGEGSGVVNITEAKDRWGRTALHHALEFGEGGDRAALQRVQVLLEHGAPPMAIDRDGRNVLMLAAGKGYARTVRYLLERNATLASKMDLQQRCALHYASQRAALMNRVDRETLQIMTALVDAMEAFGGRGQQVLLKRMAWLPYRKDEVAAPPRSTSTTKTKDAGQVEDDEEVFDEDLLGHQPVKGAAFQGATGAGDLNQQDYDEEEEEEEEDNKDGWDGALSPNAAVGQHERASFNEADEDEATTEDEQDQQQHDGGPQKEQVQEEEEEEVQSEGGLEEGEIVSQQQHPGYFAAVGGEEQMASFRANEEASNKTDNGDNQDVPPPPPRLVRKDSLQSAFFNRLQSVRAALQIDNFNDFAEAVMAMERAARPETLDDRTAKVLHEVVTMAATRPVYREKVFKVVEATGLQPRGLAEDFNDL